MTYAEILHWIEENLVSVRQNMDENFDVVYFDERGVHSYKTGPSLVNIVLNINGKTLIS